jgi:hypothetical protein
MPLTFAVAPGKQGDLKTVGGLFESYMDKRYKENMLLNNELFVIFDTGCFRNNTRSLRTFEECATNKPVECLVACNIDPYFQLSLNALKARLVAQSQSSRQLGGQLQDFVAVVDEKTRNAAMKRRLRLKA